ncbi:toxic anion resistance protein, partial [Staphylococcus capitis]|uniref:toxic anion resistance protein n=1 Tax=Staphylococcus capitis TaxID=29388 RepID=UPI001642A4DF
LDKPIYHLQFSTQIPIQTPPQIPIIQNLNQPLPQKIQTSILTTIPLSKNQIAIPLTLITQPNPLSPHPPLTHTTNHLLTQNPSILNQNPIQTPTQNHPPIVHIHTLKTTQNHIIQTI